MAGLLAAEAVAAPLHLLVDILVADLGLLVGNTLALKRFVKSEIRHNRRHDAVVCEFAALLHVLAADVENAVAVHELAVLIDREAAVRIAVKGKADVAVLPLDGLDQILDVRRAAAEVNVRAVRLRVNHNRRRAERVEHIFRNARGRTVRAVERHFHILKRARRERNQMADVAVASRREVRRAADILAARERQFRRRPVNPRFDCFDDGLLHLLAVAI